MPSVFTINTGPLESLGARYDSASAHLAGANAAGVEHVRLTQEIFDREGSPLARWPAKAVPSGVKVTAENRDMLASPRLQDTGALVGSINYRPTSQGYVIGPADLPYAAVHQFGAAIPVSDKMRGFLHHLGFHLRASTKVVHIPQRKYIGVAPEWEEPIAQAYLGAKLKDATGGR